MIGRIAVTYFEWAGHNTQRIVVPWQIIDGPETADAFVAKLAVAPISRWYRTSVSGAILFGQEMFENNGFDAPRRVLDISGDGANNSGIPVENARTLIADRGELGFRAIYNKSGLPEAMFPAVKLLLKIVRELDAEGAQNGSSRYANSVVERILHYSEENPVENLSYIIALVRRVAQ
jgi:hypothetical protein